MRNYLSFGGGVNSVAMYLLMEDLGVEFEAVFVNHGGDWPETYEYVDYFIGTGRPVTVLTPSVRSRRGKVFGNIVEYFEHLSVLPSKNPKRKFCTQKFKSSILDAYQEPPCFVFIGYASDEDNRAKISSKGGYEYRWPLIEYDIDRAGCIELIKKHGLKVPPKSGCYICPYQGAEEYRKLRKLHPELFCRAQKLEAAQNGRVTRDGRPWKPYYLAGNRPLGLIIDERQGVIPGFVEAEYPPCQCGM